MKKKNLFFMLVVLAFALINCDCDDSEPGPGTGGDKTLSGTKWKLEGIVDAETGELRVLWPIDCEWCYTIAFDICKHVYFDKCSLNVPENNFFIAYSTNNRFDGYYAADYETDSIHIIDLSRTGMSEIGNGQLWGDIFSNINTFSLQDNKLMLYDSYNRYYLLFKPLEELCTKKKILFCMLTALAFDVTSCDCDDNEPAPDTTLSGTMWKLEGIGDVQTGELKVPEPRECEICHTLAFDIGSPIFTDVSEDNFFVANSSSNKMDGTYSADYKTNNIIITSLGGTKKGEIGDGNLWWDIFPKINTFSLQNNKLMLYYNDNKNYLLFKSFEESWEESWEKIFLR